MIREFTININTHGEEILNDKEFKEVMSSYKNDMGLDENIRSLSIALHQYSDKFKFTYQQEWCGVPVIRLPDDIVVLQEIIWYLKPSFIIETGVARGGGLILDASLMALAQLKPNVLGIDIQILDHASSAILDCAYSEYIELIECDSASEKAVKKVKDFLSKNSLKDPGLLVLDSDHTHHHVYEELRALTPLLPVGSLILVADTFIDEMPSDYYSDRPWGPGNNPLTAVNSFLSENPNFERLTAWSRRGLLSEFRDGILQKVK